MAFLLSEVGRLQHVFKGSRSWCEIRSIFWLEISQTASCDSRNGFLSLGTSKKIWQFSPGWGHLCFQSWSTTIPNVVGAPTDIQGWNQIEHNHTNHRQTLVLRVHAGKQLEGRGHLVGSWRLVAPTKVPTFVLELVYQLPKPRTDCDGDVQKELLKLKTEPFANIAAKFKSYMYMCYALWSFHTVSQNSTGWCSTLTLLLICSSFSRENDHPLLMNAHQDQCKFYILHPSPPFFPCSSRNFQKRLGKETPHLQTILQLKHSISAWIARRPTHLWDTNHLGGEKTTRATWMSR